MKFIKVIKLGEMGIHFYELGGVVEAIECSVEEYDALALPNASSPLFPEGAVWLQSIKRPKFDTPDGTLREGEYGDDGKGIAWVRPFGGMEVLTKVENIVEDEPNIQALDDINKQLISTPQMVEIKKNANSF